MEGATLLAPSAWAAHYIQVAAAMLLFGGALFPFYAGFGGGSPSPQVLAIRLSPSVDPLVKITSLGLGALMNRATVWRAAVKRDAARRASVWTGAGLALSVE